MGAILTTGKRTITSVLVVMGLNQEEHFQNYHRVLNRAVWSSLEASRILLMLMVTVFLPTIKVNRWYGEGERRVEVCTGTAVWYHTGLPVVPIRWVLVRDPLGKFESQALLSTFKEYSPKQILEWFGSNAKK